MKWEDYKALDRMNASTLVHGLHSMKHLKAAMDGDYRKESPSLSFGQLYHTLILEPDEFANQYVVTPDFANDPGNVDAKGDPSVSSRTKWCRERVAEFANEHAGKQFVCQRDCDRAERIRDAVLADKRARDLLENCKHEVTLLGEIDGIEFKGRCDLLGPAVLADIKGARSIVDHEFGRDCCNYHYGFKLAIYRELSRQNGNHLEQVELIAVETDGLHDCCVYEVPESLLDAGWNSVQRVITQVEECKETGVWPGVNRGEQTKPLFVPNWAMPDFDSLDWSE